MLKMKDLTHYFADSFRTLETSPAEPIEVSINSENDSEVIKSKKSNHVPKKRGRNNKKSSPDAKHSKKSKSELNIEKSKPLVNGSKDDILKDDVLRDTPKKSDDENIPELISEEFSNENSSTSSNFKNSDLIEPQKNEPESNDLANEDRNDVCIDQNHAEEKIVQNETSHDDNSKNSPSNKSSEKMETEASILTQDDKKKKRKEKIKILAEKKGYTKRKQMEDEEAEELDKKLQERKNVFTNVPKKDENQAEIIYKPPAYSLLNYFSKATPEQRQKEEAAKCKISVKAEVHTPKEGETPNSTSNSTPKSHCSKTPQSKKKRAEIKQAISEIDEIHFVRSESLSPPPIPQDKKANKPKWRIQFQSGNFTNGVSNDEALSSNSISKIQKENEKIEEAAIVKGVVSKEKENPSKSGNSDTETLQSKRKTRSSKYKAKKKMKDISENDKCTEKDEEEKKIGSEKVHVDNDKKEALIHEITIVEEIPVKRSAPEKIAPLFIKKRKLDPTVIEARRLFLQSDMSESENRPTKQKPSPVPNPLLPFPLISHVTQLDSEVNSENSEINFRLKSSCNFSPSLNLRKFENITSKNDSNIKRWISTLDHTNSRVEIEEVLSDIEKRCDDARLIWKSISQTAKLVSPKQSPRGRTSKRKAAMKKNTQIEEMKIDNHDDVWICKYKPKSTQEIVGNEQAAIRLKTWLEKWKTPVTTEEINSDDDFYSSDCSSTSSRREYNQVAVLLGPHGCGKTASVYAVAQELGYSVLEINASSRRTGKRIFKELEEATKSHRIRKSDMKHTFLKTHAEERKIPQNSLILMEDVDIIFEEDEGFVSAAFQLASKTKRPIVMTCNEACSHLCKLAPQQLCIQFQATAGNRASALLELISLAETGRKLSIPCVESLLEKGDLRKALLQLQYLLATGHTHTLPPVVDAQHRFGMPLWRKTHECLYKPAVKSSNKKRKQKSLASQDSSNDDAHILNRLADDLESVSLISKLIGVEDISWNFQKSKSVMNLSLSEDMRPYSYSDTVSSQIADWLTFEVIQKKEGLEQSVDNVSLKMMSLRTAHTKVDSILSQATSSTTDRRIIAEDYLPSIRTICRAEEIRNSSNNKRRNRFFHYLHGTKIPTNSTNILSTACKFLQEKPEKVQ